MQRCASWDLAGQETENRPSLSKVEAGHRHATISPNGRWIVGETTTVVEYQPGKQMNLRLGAQVWDLQTRKPVGLPLEHALLEQPKERPEGSLSFPPQIKQISWSGDSRRVFTVVTGSKDQPSEMRVWDTATGQPLGPPLKHHQSLGTSTSQFDWPKSIALSNDGAQVATVLPGEAGLRLWDAATGETRTLQCETPEDLDAFCLSPDGRMVLTAFGECLQWWDAVSGKPIGELFKGTYSIIGRRMTWSPDGRWVVAYTGEGVGVWNAHTRQMVGTSTGYDSDFVDHIEFSPDSARMLIVGRKEARLWEVGTVRPIGPILEIRGKVEAVAFSPDSLRLAVTSADGTVRLWDATTGQSLGPPLIRKCRQARCVAFTGDGTSLVLVDKSIRLDAGLEIESWNVGPDDRTKRTIMDFCHLVSARSVDSSGALITLSAYELAWDGIQLLSSADLTVTSAQCVAWHRREAEASLREQNGQAALCHLDELESLTPDADQRAALTKLRREAQQMVAQAASVPGKPEQE